MTPLRLQMIEDMKSAGLAPRTQAVYIDAVRRLAGHYRRSPDRLTEEEVRRYLLGLRERGVALGSFKVYHGGIQFLYRRTLDRNWALFQKKNPPAQTATASRGPLRRASPRIAGQREDTRSQGLPRPHVRLRLAHKRGRDLGNRRHRPRQSAASHHRQGRQGAARTVATTGPGWPAGALEDPPRSALALSQSFRRLGQPARAAPQLSRRRSRGGDHAASHAPRPAS